MIRINKRKRGYSEAFEFTSFNNYKSNSPITCAGNEIFIYNENIKDDDDNIISPPLCDLQMDYLLNSTAENCLSICAV